MRSKARSFGWFHVNAVCGLGPVFLLVQLSLKSISIHKFVLLLSEQNFSKRVLHHNSAS
jgi:hypothetical protein